ncbi:hypothetical protein NSP_53440 [Nodularia spumigena CCY9414]|nr:hypothetical protein NSP_53440 [Nodularia spumigena CCY9414]
MLGGFEVIAVMELTIFSLDLALMVICGKFLVLLTLNFKLIA